jgi:hypothetical protein
MSREEAMRPHHKDRQEDDMTSQDLPSGIELGADRLSDTKDDATCERSPHAAQSAQNDDFEGDE